MLVTAAGRAMGAVAMAPAMPATTSPMLRSFLKKGGVGLRILRMSCFMVCGFWCV